MSTISQLASKCSNFFSHYSALFGVRVSLLSPSGEEVLSDVSRPICSYCSLLRNQLSLEAVCTKFHQEIERKAIQKSQTAESACHCGIQAIIYPIFFESSCIALISISEFRQVTQIPPAILQRSIGMSKDKVAQNEFTKLPYFRRAELLHIQGLLEAYMDSMHSSDALLPEIVEPHERVIRYMRRLPNARITLAEASRIACKSSSRLSHVFSEKYGKSFKQIQTEMVLARAEEMMAANRFPSIMEIAQVLGFESSLSFSKFVKRHTGLSTKQFQKKICSRHRSPA